MHRLGETRRKNDPLRSARRLWHRRTPRVDNCQHLATMGAGKGPRTPLLRTILALASGKRLVSGWSLRVSGSGALSHGQETAPDQGDCRRRGICRSTGLGYCPRRCTRLGYFAMPSWAAGWLQTFGVVDPTRPVPSRASDSAGSRPMPPLNSEVGKCHRLQRGT